MNGPGPLLYRIPFDLPGEALPGPATVGNKGHNLMRMAGHVPVPPAFVIPVDISRQYRKIRGAAITQLSEAIGKELANLGYLTGRTFGSKRSPFLVSVRSSAAVSMPGMMETVLNIGLNEETLRGLIKLTGNPKFAWDCMVRFIRQYAEVVHGLPAQLFAQALAHHLQASEGAGLEELDIESAKAVVMEFSDIFKTKTGRPFPASPEEQLLAAIEAIIRSWYGNRAAIYRRLHAIPDDIGTAVIVQVMVFGNTGRNSGSGVGFTRNPANGYKEPYLDFLGNAQGEDIVSGRRNADQADALALHLPKVHAELLQVCGWLEEEFGDMQDFEFTVEEGRLSLLQSRNGMRTSLAALKIAVDMVEEGIMTPIRAAELITGIDPAGFTRACLAVNDHDQPVARAISAGTGVAVGAAVFDPYRIERYLEKGGEVIYLDRTLSAEDIEIIHRVQGLITSLGARTSHAAVVARQLGKVCLVACAELRIGGDLRHGYLGETRVKEGDFLSLDGDTGLV